MTYNIVTAAHGSAGVDPSVFRQAMGQFATGVAVVTTKEDGLSFGMTVNSLTSVSLDPCLLLVCPKKGSLTGEAIKRRGMFAVNIMEEGQEELCLRFVGEDAARFEGLDVLDKRGMPLLPQSLVHLVCSVYSVYPGGDHEIIVGQVLDCQAGNGDPLVFHQGRFCRRIA